MIATKKGLILKRYHDPGHSWLAVKRSLLNKVQSRVSSYSYEKGETVYLEEDCDLHAFLRRARDKGLDIQILDKHTNDRSPIRSYEPFTGRPGETYIQNGTKCCQRWWCKYNANAYAIGPMNFGRPVTAAEASEYFKEQGGTHPAEVWTGGDYTDVDDYEYLLGR